MSNTGDERWRTVQKQRNAQDQSQSQSHNPNPHQSRQPNQHRPSSSRGSGVAGQPQRTRESGAQGFTTMSGNAWNNDRGLREPSQYGPTQDQHVPVNGFNAADARDTLKNALNSVNRKSTSYKNPGQAQGTKSGLPWATKPNTMGNGKEFFLDLRKYLSAGPERAGG